MNARNRMADVKKLRTNACQELLSLIIVDGWQEKLYQIALKAKNNKDHADSYAAALSKMDDYGVSKYSISDMDVTIIATCLLYKQDMITITLHPGTRSAFYKIKDDKNLNSHSGDNEDQEELYLQELYFLNDLAEFVRNFDDYERSKIGKDDSLTIRQKYLSKIDEFKATLDNERIELIHRQKKRAEDIQRIKESKDQRQIWFEYFELYVCEMRNKKDSTEFEAFVYEAAEAGITYAYPSAVDNYVIRGDYDKAEQYLRYLYENRQEHNTTPEHLMLLADIYIHGKCKKTGDGYAILQSLIDEGYNIALSEDKTKYQLYSKNNGRCYYTIELPQQ